MNNEEFKAIMSSLARIEFLIKIIMEEKYGRKEANRVYNEVVKRIDSQLFSGGEENDA